MPFTLKEFKESLKHNCAASACHSKKNLSIIGEEFDQAPNVYDSYNDGNLVAREGGKEHFEGLLIEEDEKPLIVMVSPDPNRHRTRSTRTREVNLSKKRERSAPTKLETKRETPNSGSYYSRWDKPIPRSPKPPKIPVPADKPFYQTQGVSSLMDEPEIILLPSRAMDEVRIRNRGLFSEVIVGVEPDTFRIQKNMMMIGGIGGNTPVFRPGFPSASQSPAPFQGSPNTPFQGSIKEFGFPSKKRISSPSPMNDGFKFSNQTKFNGTSNPSYPSNLYGPPPGQSMYQKINTLYPNLGLIPSRNTSPFPIQKEIIKMGPEVRQQSTTPVSIINEKQDKTDSEDNFGKYVSISKSNSTGHLRQGSGERKKKVETPTLTPRLIPSGCLSSQKMFILNGKRPILNYDDDKINNEPQQSSTVSLEGKNKNFNKISNIQKYDEKDTIISSKSTENHEISSDDRLHTTNHDISQLPPSDIHTNLSSSYPGLPESHRTTHHLESHRTTHPNDCPRNNESVISEEVSESKSQYAVTHGECPGQSIRSHTQTMTTRVSIPQQTNMTVISSDSSPPSFDISFISSPTPNQMEPRREEAHLIVDNNPVLVQDTADPATDNTLPSAPIIKNNELDKIEDSNAAPQSVLQNGQHALSSRSKINESEPTKDSNEAPQSVLQNGQHVLSSRSKINESEPTKDSNEAPQSVLQNGQHVLSSRSKINESEPTKDSNAAPQPILHNERIMSLPPTSKLIQAEDNRTVLNVNGKQDVNGSKDNKAVPRSITPNHNASIRNRLAFIPRSSWRRGERLNNTPFFGMPPPPTRNTKLSEGTRSNDLRSASTDVHSESNENSSSSWYHSRQASRERPITSFVPGPRMFSAFGNVFQKSASSSKITQSATSTQKNTRLQNI